MSKKLVLCWLLAACLRPALAASDTVTAVMPDTVTAVMPAARPRVAVVLSGGGAKGMAHIGALKVIERAGIPVDIVTGTSMGSIVGGLYAVGYDAATLDSLVRRQDWLFLLSDKETIRSPFINDREKENTYFLSKTLHFSGGKLQNNVGGFIEGRNLARLFDNLTEGYHDSIDFSRLPIPFSCVATNIIDNTEYDFHSGRLSEAMRASMSIPGAFSPVRKGDMVLVDGGLRNNFPADIAKEMGADVIIGVTVQGPPKTAEDIKGGASILSQIVDVNCKNKYDDNLAITDIPIRVNTKGYGSASFTPAAIDTLIRRGEEEAMRHWDALEALGQKMRAFGVTDARAGLQARPVTGALQENEDSLAKWRSRTSMIQGNVGVRFDSEEMVALQLNGLYQPARSPWEFGATIRLGKRSEARVEAQLVPLHFCNMRLAYIFRHSDINVYVEGDKEANVTFNQHAVDFTLFSFMIRNFQVDIGARFDYYRFQDFLTGSVAETFTDSLKDMHTYSYYGKVNYNSEDLWYFPSRGAKFTAGYAYYTDNLIGYDGHTGISIIDAMWRMSFPLGRRLTLQPMAYGRLLFGHDIHAILHNRIGGDWFNHYFEGQMPFAGLGHVELTRKQFVALQLKLQQRIMDNNYILLKVAAAQRAESLGDLLKHGPMRGYQLAYYYNSMFGPLGATAGYNSYSKSPYFFVNLGFVF